MTPRPIFVYGTARSGTTLLTNLLLGHDAVAGLAHPLHWGAHEIPLHDYRRYWGDFDRPERYERFLSDLEGSDVDRLAGGLGSARPERRPADVYEWLLQLMDAVAESRGCNFWTMKLDPRVVQRPREFGRLRSVMRERYDQVHIVAVRRDPDEVLRSYVRMPGPTLAARSTRAGAAAAHLLGLARLRVHAGDLDRLVREEGALLVEFRTLVERPDEVVRLLRARIGELGELADAGYPRNTSFHAKGEAAPRGSSPGWDLAAAAFDRMPGLARHLLRAWESRPVAANPLYYRLARAERDPDGLVDELRRSGHDALVSHVEAMRGD